MTERLALSSADAEILGTGEEFEFSQLENGTVGWIHDADAEHFEIVDSVTLVNVTLFRGHPVGKPKSADGRANGLRVQCRIGLSGIWYIPKPGTLVIVAFPGKHGMESAGNGVIIATPGKSPKRQFGDEQVMLDFTGYDVVIKGRSVTLISDDVDGGQQVRHIMSVSRQGGCQVVDATGSGVFVKDASCQMKSLDAGKNRVASVSCTNKSITILDATSSKQQMVKFANGSMSCTGDACTLKYGAVGLGPAPSAATPVCVGPGGLANVGSKSIFGSA